MPTADPAHDTPFISPADGAPLRRDGDRLVTPEGATVARMNGRVADFIGGSGYEASFSFQWLKTDAVRSVNEILMQRHDEEMRLRTNFDSYDLRGARCLEIGAGLGDDTAFLLSRDVGAVHALDLSRSIERAAALIDDPRVTFARADVNAMPFPDQSYDLVMCHRMMQHTPHPAATLARAAKKVRPGGLLFVHSYHRSRYFMAASKYKYRWLTTRLPRRLLWGLLSITSPLLRGGTIACERWFGQPGAEFARRWSPWVVQAPHLLKDVPGRMRRRYELQVTFDALTPTYDLPMYANDFVDLIESMGFEIENIERRPWFPLWATARRVRAADTAATPDIAVKLPNATREAVA